VVRSSCASQAVTCHLSSAVRRDRLPGRRGRKLRELWSDDLESELLRDCDRGFRVVLLLGWLGRVSGRHAALLEHPLEAPGRDDDERTGALGLHLERVWHSPGPPDQGAGARDELVFSLAEADLALKHIEGFVLAAVDVEGGPNPW